MPALLTATSIRPNRSSARAHRLPYGEQIADVGHCGEDGGTGLPAQVRGVLQLARGAQRVGHPGQVGADVQQREVRALDSARDRGGPAESTGGAGDEDRLAVQTHGELLQETSVETMTRTRAGAASVRYMWPPGSSTYAKSRAVDLLQDTASS